MHNSIVQRVAKYPNLQLLFVSSSTMASQISCFLEFRCNGLTFQNNNNDNNNNNNDNNNNNNNNNNNIYIIVKPVEDFVEISDILMIN